MNIELVHCKKSRLGSTRRQSEGGEGRKRFINTTPVFASIRAAECAGIIRALDWDGPTSRTILLFAAIDPSGLRIVCAGIWRWTGPAAEECRTLKVCQAGGEGKIAQRSRHLGLVPEANGNRVGLSCSLTGVFRMRFEDCAVWGNKLTRRLKTKKMPLI